MYPNKKNPLNGTNREAKEITSWLTNLHIKQDFLPQGIESLSHIK